MLFKLFFFFTDENKLECLSLGSIYNLVLFLPVRGAYECSCITLPPGHTSKYETRLERLSPLTTTVAYFLDHHPKTLSSLTL
jgi:hypothetical protein